MNGFVSKRCLILYCNPIMSIMTSAQQKWLKWHASQENTSQVYENL